MAMFKKVLIANRGEIARRIIRTCRNLGIQTVAIYADADAGAPFVKEADECYPLGESQPLKSYLNGSKILSIAKACNAEAIHPGYGFLSENAAFAKSCAEDGIRFIGPKHDVIQLMGDKIEARKQMSKAGVPIVPGCDKPLESLVEAIEVAKALGYPVMLKASAGGGGIGMQLIESEDELQAAYTTIIQKSTAYFGNGAVYLEKFIRNPRHIEVQVACDEFGNAVHLFERECSIQRRNQKVIEEAPSPFLDQAIRQTLCDTAVSGAQQIGYTNVGTMEFIFDESGNFYFLEMNTRLQVEHPVTEMITGLDLVEWQLKIAAEEPLPLAQADIHLLGSAIEARVYAEDPVTYFPSPGTITKLELPQGKARFDFAVEEGSHVSHFYDPMIGKIIAWSSSRSETIGQLDQVLRETKIEGIKSNLPLLKDIVERQEFLKGQYTTRFLDQYRFHPSGE